MSHSQKDIITKEQAIHKLWRKGILHWKLDDNQTEMYNFAKQKGAKTVVIGCSRRLGKSYFLVALAIETCLQKPNAIVKFVAPTVKDLRMIITPLVKEITRDAPKDIAPKYVRDTHSYNFKNGSQIQLAGTDNGHADSIRGGNADLCLIDEAGFCTELDYVVNSILIPTTTLTGGKIIMASTPPKNMGHPFVGFMQDAENRGSFIKRTIYDNKRLSAEQIAEIADSVGGVESIDFKREYMVEMVTDTNFAVIPEFTPELQAEVIKAVPKPTFYDAYVGMDIGGQDLTVALFAYLDFRTGTLIVEDEVVLSGKMAVSDIIAQSIDQKENLLWQDSYGMKRSPYMRVADNNNIILLNDLQLKHQLTFIPAPKDNAEAQLNNLRLLLKAKKILINPRCVTLISHLKNAIWNKSRKSYIRTAEHGHFDALDALKYMVRMVDFKKNPYPSGYDLDPHRDYHTPAPKTEQTPLDTQIKAMFKPRFGRRRY